VIDDPDDLTLPIMTRYFLYSTELRDFRLNTATMSEIMHPYHPTLLAYRDKHPPPPHLLEQILKGCECPSNISSTKLLTSFASHLTRLKGTEADQALKFLNDLFYLAQGEVENDYANRSEEFIQAIYHKIYCGFTLRNNSS